MELPNDMILDIALNAAGYIAAGILSVTIYSMFSGRSKKTKQLASAGMPVVQDTKSVPAHSVPTQFINLKDVSASGANTKKSTPKQQSNLKISRSDRVGTIRIAREMLKAGATSEKIQRVLPISEAELALLNYQE